VSIFCVKKITPPVRLGQLLQEARLKTGYTLFSLEQKTHIAEKYLRAIEENNFSVLPSARAYRLAYVRELSNAINYNAGKAVYQFINENGLGDIKTIHPQSGIKKLQSHLASWFVRSVLIIGIIIIFVGYLAWQVKGILTPPILNLYSPMEGAIINQTEITIAGETEKETHLTINGQEARVNEQGKFNTILNLSTGVNIITITATKKHGKTVTITRHVVVK
jgi:cytoskeletal protein RodZ